MSERICIHMKPFAARCIECELIMAREAVDHAKDSLNLHSKLVAKLEAEQRLTSSLSRQQSGDGA